MSYQSSARIGIHAGGPSAGCGAGFSRVVIPLGGLFPLPVVSLGTAWSTANHHEHEHADGVLVMGVACVFSTAQMEAVDPFRSQSGPCPVPLNDSVQCLGAKKTRGGIMDRTHIQCTGGTRKHGGQFRPTPMVSHSVLPQWRIAA